MTVRRKLFVSIASFIVAMSVIFVLVTQFVVKAALEHIRIVDRSEQMTELSEIFLDYFKQSGGSWDRAQDDPIVLNGYKNLPTASILLKSATGEVLYSQGEASFEMITRLGIHSDIRLNGETIAVLYYHDPEVANLSKIQIGISSSVSTLLMIGSLIFLLVSLLIANWLSKRLTRPLGQLLPAIERLGRGELGVQAPVSSKDEYGTVARALNNMSQQLQLAEEVRRNLVADVSHELRTPLTILRGKLDLIQEFGHSIKPEALLPLQDELIRLTRLVDDLHQLSLAEAKKLSIDRKLTNIEALLQRMIERVEDDAESKRVAIVLHRTSNVPEILIDPYRMTQVFLNLLVNAIRHTPSGGLITVNIEADKRPVDESGSLRISITDTGTGINPEHLPYIFNRFYRADEARTRHSGGMGLGLAIAKEFVLAHNGTMDVSSTLGEGTTFIVTLPIVTR
ncbi:sensor histidine kinase [Paenibacillus mendelii]|uniref:histidine kinase n=1 Tax=Paenibacillus mendelii TaxID=206163 RepID=A0ABV6JCG4_9BACL|nr:ATP-binding protein [Paenibacillus mendelii]MCQ6561596.1 ATP-binding protein [Paenibacillus mendelii]